MKYTLLANAVMFWIIGLGIIFFLVSELGISVNAAVSGNWKWRKTMQSLRHASVKSDVSLVDMFDLIDAKKRLATTVDPLLVESVCVGFTRLPAQYSTNVGRGQ